MYITFLSLFYAYPLHKKQKQSFYYRYRMCAHLKSSTITLRIYKINKCQATWKM